MKFFLKGRYDADKGTAATTIPINVSQVKLRASVTDATVISGPSFNGLAFVVEKPRFFIVNYNVPQKDFRFQFINAIRAAEKPLNLTYSHSRVDNRTMLDGILVVDLDNKLSANHVFGSRNCKLKYTYLHQGLTNFEPSYNLATNSWDFTVSRRVYSNDVFKASYQTSSKALGF